jgi:cell division protein FtsZ
MAADAAHAAVAAAILPATAIEDVSIRPMPMKPSLFEAPVEETPEPSLPKAFIPPAAERPMAPVRMPRIDELPIPAQNEIKAQRGELAADHPEKRRMSLMQRLASVGLGRKDEAPQPPQTAHHQPPMPQAKRPPMRPAPRPPEARPDPVSEYARRPAPQGLDSHGRAAPVQSPSEDDQLEIPAFLRRQAN